MRAEPRSLLLRAQVLVNIRAMPINPGDVYNVKMGATPYSVRAGARARAVAVQPGVCSAAAQAAHWLTHCVACTRLRAA
jgi:hypothetical protein